jgi:hypothetical protein
MHFGSRRAGGYVVITDPDKPTVERDSICCYHCQRHVLIPPGPPPAGEELYGVCWSCSKFICPPCAKKRTCTPWEKQMERMEARDRLRRAVGV